MTNNDRIILDQVLAQQKENAPSGLDDSTYFEMFVAEQVLKDYDLSYEEIEYGIVGGGGDGGVDGFYVFVNGELIQEDTDFNVSRKNIEINLVIIQAKTSTGFSESVMDKFISVSADLFDLSKSIDDMASVYNEKLLDAARLFRKVYQSLAAKFPKFSVSFYYATKGETPHPNVLRKTAKLETVIKQYFSAAEFRCDFMGARQILDLARRAPVTSYELKLAENPISAAGDVAFVCLVALKDFFRFITDPQGRILRHIFEANVRDYQGKTAVNEQIQEALQHPGTEDFWWLNNGITIIASRATQGGKTLTIEAPEIVNGLQTSTEVYSYVTSCNTDAEKRNVLVRVVVPVASESREHIIKATNSQTAIPLASLRATDKIHRDIEEYLKSFGLYYDRRKNHYKNDGKPLNRIVSIPQMAQAVMSIVLGRPDTARARPSSLLKEDTEYHRLFNMHFPIQLYRACAEILKQSDTFIAGHADTLTLTDRNNLKYYLAMVVVREILTNITPSSQLIASLAGQTIDPAKLETAYQLVVGEYRRNGGTDQLAKGPNLLAAIQAQLDTKYPKAVIPARP